MVSAPVPHSQPDNADLINRALNFRLGVRQIYETQQDRPDIMWFFELWHFLGDVQDAVAALPQSGVQCGDAVKLMAVIDAALARYADIEKHGGLTDMGRHAHGTTKLLKQEMEAALSLPEKAEGREPDFDAAAKALGFIRLPDGKWRASTMSADRNTSQRWDSAEQIFVWWGRASGNVAPSTVSSADRGSK